MLVHQRNNDVIQNIDMDALQAEVAGVIAKYVNIARNADAKVNLKQDGDFDCLEMHFPLDQNSLGAAGGQKKISHGTYAH
jgi:septum formation topological specificity factor MinE